MSTISSAGKGETIVLLYGPENNFLAWKKFIFAKTEKEFGFLANVIKTNNAYAVEPVKEMDYTPPVEEGQTQLDSEGLKVLRLEVERTRLKKVGRLQEMMPRFYAAILETLSEESLQQVSQDEEFVEADAARNGNLLWKIIEKTHFSAVKACGLTGVSTLMLEQELFNFKQGERVSVAEFKREFEEKLLLLKSAGVTERNDKDKALLFLMKLDPNRYSTMILTLTNDASLGRAIPETLPAMFKVANEWQVERKASNKSSSGIDSIFHSADSIVSKKPTGKYGGKSAKPASKTVSSSSVSSSAGDASTASSDVETRTCNHCHQEGHLWRKCPSRLTAIEADKKRFEKASNANVLFAPEGEFDSEDENSSGYSFVSPDAFVLFGDCELLLDNQASRSIFHDRGNLLHSVGDLECPFNVGGINADGAPMRVQKGGKLESLPIQIGVHSGCAANILSKTQLIDAGAKVRYVDDHYVLNDEMVFDRKMLPNGEKSSHYSCDLALVGTIEDNMRRFTQRELKGASAARRFIAASGYPSNKAAVDMLNQGILNCPVTPSDVRNAESIYGDSVATLKGKTTKKTPTAIPTDPTVSVTQVEQVLAIDVFFLKQLPFLIGLLIPLGLILCAYLPNRTATVVGDALKTFISTAKKQGFNVREIHSDGEGAVKAVEDQFDDIVFEQSGSGQHIPVIERMGRAVKERVRCHEHSLPYLMPRSIFICCVLFCCSRLNMQPRATSIDRVSPIEQFTGRKLDYKLDFRVEFGDYCQATVPNTDNSMASRTEGCIAVLPKGNLRGSVGMVKLGTKKIVTRDQFKVLPMPDILIQYLNEWAERDGICHRGLEPATRIPSEPVPHSTTMMPIDRHDNLDTLDVNDLPSGEDVNQAADDDPAATEDAHASAPDAGVNVPLDALFEPEPTVAVEPPPFDDFVEPVVVEPTPAANPGTLDQPTKTAPKRRVFKHSVSVLEGTGGANFDNLLCHCFKMSVKKALKDRKDDATPVIMAELQQIYDKGVFHPVLIKNLTEAERGAIIRSSMFLKDKYLASGVFEKFKARLVAGGDGQDKELYDNLSSPTAHTTSVFVIAAIAAAEERSVMTIDVGGAFLNAPMEPTGIKVHMRLDKLMTSMLLKIDSSYQEYVQSNGTLVVQLDKALYGCVEAAMLWFRHLKRTLIDNGFTQNKYDECVFNKTETDGTQTTIVLHVDDMMVTAACEEHLDLVNENLKETYPHTTMKKGKVIDYIGMTFDFGVIGEVKVTMANCVNDIVSGSGVETIRATPATSALFDVRDAPLATDEERIWFHCYVAKILYLAKRVRPECLTAVAFLTSRIHVCDQDDLAKLRRLLGYLGGSKERGIVLRIGDEINVKAYIDASYGVHQDSGKSHTGCAIVIGDGGPVFAKSTKQRIVTKSSTEAELVGLSDSASVAINVRNFVIDQGYDLGPAIVYQDNLSCMALIKRGGPGSERSRHINIRHFWVAQKVEDKEVVVEHLGTASMHANILTKPVQGRQFVKERADLTNWE